MSISQVRTLWSQLLMKHYTLYIYSFFKVETNHFKSYIRWKSINWLNWSNLKPLIEKINLWYIPLIFYFIKTR
jgi:hypothetical protein